ncbi:CCA tRNA nucleotidyltransferase [Jeotgalibacillus malaysiensis]|uniref:CCA tRNA nucleotidyltransferase n=1 Tax=Jeotgalibacillus malaysiensis TaxID=1508404 RepID=UPI00384B3AF0
MNELFSQALPVLKEIEANGYEAYFVGGCVRDYYLSREINDIDIAVSATPEEIKQIFKKTIDVGIEHGTILVLHEKGQFEMTTFRTESTYSDSRRPDKVTFVRSLEEDLKRRDFTMNAMALSSSYELTDLFGGREDLQKKEIKTVGLPMERFEEDALRMLRAVRFVSQLDFSIENHTFEAIRVYARRLSRVATERIAAELEKLINGPAMERALRYVIETNLHAYLPVLITEKVVKSLGEIDWKVLNAGERLALIIAIGEFDDVKTLLKQWKMSNKTIKKQLSLSDLLTIRAGRAFTKADIYHMGIEPVTSAEKIAAVLNQRPYDAQYMEDLYHSMRIKSRSDLAFKGTHLIKWTGKKGGPWVKDCTSVIEQLILDEELENNLSDIKEWVESEWLQK